MSVQSATIEIKHTMDPVISQNANNNVENLDGSLNSTDNIADVFSDLKDEMKEVLSHFKTLCTTLDDTEKKFKNKRLDSLTPQKQDKEIAALRNDVNGFVGAFRTGNNIIGNVASGNVAGGVITGVNSIGSSLMTGGINAATAAGGATALAKSLLVGGGVALALGAAAAGANKLADVYGDALPGIDSLYGSFGGRNLGSNSLLQNRRFGLSMRDTILDKNIGTGMDADSFISLTSSLGKYGISNVNRAATLAQNSAQWASYTGADPNSIANFAGLVERYGGNGQNALTNVFGAARATGLEKGQYNEFLEGIQRSMEDGIARGFIRSAEDVSKNIANITLMSGNSDYWKGQAGINRYNSMSNAMSGNTSLSTSSSMLLYRAMQNSMGNNANWVDVMSKIEDGQWGDQGFIDNYKNVLNNAYGSDQNGIISTIKENFGLNWKGAKEVYNTLYNGNTTDVEGTIKALQENPEYQSDSKTMNEALTTLNKSIVRMGSGLFGAKYGALDGISKTVDDIYSFLNPNDKKIISDADLYKGEIRTEDQLEMYGGNFTTWNDFEKAFGKGNIYEQIIKGTDAEDDFLKFITDYTETDSKGVTRIGKDRIEDFFSENSVYAAIGNKLIEALDNLTREMEGGIEVETRGAFDGYQRGGR